MSRGGDGEQQGDRKLRLPVGVPPSLRTSRGQGLSGQDPDGTKVLVAPGSPKNPGRSPEMGLCFLPVGPTDRCTASALRLQTRTHTSDLESWRLRSSKENKPGGVGERMRSLRVRCLRNETR